MNRNIKKGDIVQVTNSGHYYPTFDSFARKLRARNWIENYLGHYGGIDLKKGKVINFGLDGDIGIYLVEMLDTHKEILIAEDGIRFVKKDIEEKRKRIINSFASFMQYVEENHTRKKRNGKYRITKRLQKVCSRKV